MIPTFLKRDIAQSLAVGFAFCFLFCHALALNPFTLYSGYDQSIFEQMGLGMLQGRIPYVDLFDHKGFLLYLINAAGLWLSLGHTGIYCLLSLSLALTFLFWLHISDHIVHHSLRYVAPLAALLFALTCEGGNMTETWSLPWISIPIYYLVRYLSGGQMMNLRESFFIGICIGLVANLRLNNIVPAITVCMYMFIEFCLKRKFRDLIGFTLTVIGGLSFITLALVVLYIILYGTQHIRDYLFCNIGFNLIYVDHFTHKPLWTAGGIYFPLSMMIVMLCIRRNYGDKLMWFTLLAFLLTIMTTGKAHFAHYFTLFAPLVVLSISLSLGKSLYIQSRFWRLCGVGLLIGGMGVIYIFHTDIWLDVVNYHTREQAIRECAFRLHSLPQKQKASVWNYNTMMKGANILTRAGIVQHNRIFLQYQVEGDYGVKEIGAIEEIYPEVILVDDFTRWEGGIRKDALESLGSPKDSLFIAKEYRKLYRDKTLGVCIYIKRRGPEV